MFVWMVKDALSWLTAVTVESKFYHRMVNLCLNLETVDHKNLTAPLDVSTMITSSLCVTVMIIL